MAWPARLLVDEQNLRLAIRWFFTHDISPLPHMFRTLCFFWQMNDRMRNGLEWIDELRVRVESLDDRARAETLVFRLARQERDVWVTWPTRVAALIAAQLSAEMEKASGAAVTIETAILQRVLEAHVRQQLDALADLRVSLG